MLGGEHAERGGESERVHELADGGAFAAGDHQAVETLEVLGEPDLDGVGAEAAQHRDVLPESPLEGEYPYAGRAMGGQAVSKTRQRATNRDAG